MSTATSDEIESIESFRDRAEAWLSARRVRKVPTASTWGEGHFDVTVFHDRSEEQERRYLADYVAWHHEKLAAGFAAVTWPVAAGGAGLSSAHERAFKDVESQFEVPNDHELISVTVKLIAPTIEKYGTPEQIQRYGRKFLRADEFCCQLFSEPGAGSDLANLSTRAVRDGESWVLNGQKVWSSNARIAPWGFAICRTDVDVPKHAGLTAFLVPLQHPGVDVRPIRQMNGGASFNEVFFADAVIGDHLRVGAVGEGWKVALAVLGFERNSSGGSGRRGGDFDDLLGLARSVGRTADPIVRQGLAKVYSTQRVREWARFRAAASVALGGSPGPEGSIGKLLWTEAMRSISDIAAGLLGPALAADTGEWGTYAWNDHVLGAPGYRIAGGSDEIQRNIIGERVLGLPGEPRLDRDVAFKDAPR
ncbi:MAG TPA: acyl-CoA dehydrogenase family protein [Ilumatobacteraceae bacterium]|nr:acyl-CoA dehydrogenase family protein [Ilumatobacteraceae bacterium]